MDLDGALMALGWWICHQDPARTLALGNVRMPLCARCTAIYLFLGLALWVGLLAGKPAGRALLRASLAAGAGVLIVLVQWSGAQAGLWTSGAASRVLTGLAAGAGIGLLVQTTFSLRFRRARGRPWLAAALFSALAAAACIVMLTEPAWPAAARILGVASLAGFFSALAWIQAVLLSFVIGRSGGEPRRAHIAIIALTATAAEALAMSIVRI